MFNVPLPESRHKDAHMPGGCRKNKGLDRSNPTRSKAMEPLSPDHPQINLLFAIDGEPSDADARAMQDLVEALASSRKWTLSPPEFVNEEDDSSDDPEDLPIITVGGVMKLYSSFPPWDDKVPAAIDRAQYDEVVELVERMKKFSLSRGVDIVFEYDGEVVGKIRNGIALGGHPKPASRGHLKTGQSEQ